MTTQIMRITGTLLAGLFALAGGLLVVGAHIGFIVW